MRRLRAFIAAGRAPFIPAHVAPGVRAAIITNFGVEQSSQIAKNLVGAAATHAKEALTVRIVLVTAWLRTQGWSFFGAQTSLVNRYSRHIISARRRGAKVVTIDVRGTEAAVQSDEVLLIRPGSDAALALAVMHVIIRIA